VHTPTLNTQQLSSTASAHRTGVNPFSMPYPFAQGFIYVNILWSSFFRHHSRLFYWDFLFVDIGRQIARCWM